MTGFTNTVVAVQMIGTTTVSGDDGLPLVATPGEYLMWDRPAPNALMPRVVSASEFEADYERVSAKPVDIPRGGYV